MDRLQGRGRFPRFSLVGDLAAGGLLNSRDNSGDCGFSGTVFPDQSPDFSPLNLHIHMVQGHCHAEILAQIPDLHQNLSSF